MAQKIKPQPVVIVPGKKPSTVTRLGTPSAFLMLVGLFMVYYALRGWDQKYGTFSGTFIGPNNTPTGTKPRYALSNTATAIPQSTTGTPSTQSPVITI